MGIILFALVAVVVWIAATVFLGYPGLIVGALAATALAYVWILALTGGSTLLKSGDGH